MRALFSVIVAAFGFLNLAQAQGKFFGQRIVKKLTLANAGYVSLILMIVMPQLAQAQQAYTLHPPAGSPVHSSWAYTNGPTPAWYTIQTNATLDSWRAPVFATHGPDFHGATSNANNAYTVDFAPDLNGRRSIEIYLGSQASVRLPYTFGAHWYKPEAANNFSFAIATGNQPVYLYLSGQMTYMGQQTVAGGSAEVSVTPVMSATDMRPSGADIFFRTVRHSDLTGGSYEQSATTRSQLGNWVVLSPNSAHRIGIQTYAWRDMQSVRFAAAVTNEARVRLSILTREGLIQAIAQAIARAPFLLGTFDALQASPLLMPEELEALFNEEVISILCTEGVEELCEAKPCLSLDNELSCISDKELGHTGLNKTK